MNRTRKVRLATKLSLLIALTLTMSYLRSPTRAHAFTCQQLCGFGLEACLHSGGGAECTVQYNQCLAKCN
jgi:hypothetical protein